MIDLSLAVRNLLRNRRRSFATFFALALGASAILLFGGFRKNIEYNMHTWYVRAGGHLQIQHRDLFLYGSGNPTKYSIDQYESIIAAIGRDEMLNQMVSVVTPTLQFSGIASHFEANVSRTVIGLGLDAASHHRMQKWNGFGLMLPDPDFALDGTAPDATIVGTGVARVLLLCSSLGIADCPSPKKAPPPQGEELPDDIAQLAVSDVPPAADAASGKPRIELLASGSGGAPNVVSLQVVRAERQGFKELDEVYLMMHLPQAQRLIYGRTAPRVTAILIQLKESGQIEKAKQRLSALLATKAPDQALSVLDFRELNPFFTQTVQMFDMIFGFIFLLIAAIVLFTVGNTMSTAVMERTIEIGTIRTLGLRQSGVQRMFIVEGALLGVAGAIAGAVFAIVASGLLNLSGLTWLPPGGGGRQPLLVLVWGETLTIFGTTFGLILVALVSAWWPARRASHLQIVDALRHA